MNTTTKDYFTFNVHNSAVIVGQTGSGKTELVRSYVRRLEKAYTPDEMKYVFFDLKQCEFDTHFSNGTINEDGAKEEYLYAPVMYGTGADMDYLEKLADLAEERVKTGETKPLIFIYIEECDMAFEYPARFHTAVMKINKHAKEANMKLMFSTSRPSSDIIPADFRDSFDLVLCGLLASPKDGETMGNSGSLRPFEFSVQENTKT